MPAAHVYRLAAFARRPEVQRVVVGQIYDLTALALGATREGALAAGRTARVARLHAIKMDIIAHLHDGIQRL